jgi:hypothetical protein
MKRGFRFKKKSWILVGVVAVAAAMSAVGAYAFFVAQGEGQGSASVGYAEFLEVTVEDAVGGPLYPGFGSQTVDYTVKNVGDGNQKLTQVWISVAEPGPPFPEGAPWSVGLCTKDDFSINGEPAGATAIDVFDEVLAPDEEVAETITITMVETGVSQDWCQGVTLPLYLFAA